MVKIIHGTEAVECVALNNQTGLVYSSSSLCYSPYKSEDSSTAREKGLSSNMGGGKISQQVYKLCGTPSKSYLYSSQMPSKISKVNLNYHIL